MHPMAFLDLGAFPAANHHFRSEYAAGLIAAAAGFYTRSAGTLCASSQTSPPKARQIMVASVMKAHQLLIDNLAAARGSRDDNDSLAGLIVTFFSGICLEQNLGPDRARITKKIDAFMRLIRAI